jgi:hypothetical protein
VSLLVSGQGRAVSQQKLFVCLEADNMKLYSEIHTEHDDLVILTAPAGAEYETSIYRISDEGFSNFVSIFKARSEVKARRLHQHKVAQYQPSKNFCVVCGDEF